MSAPRDGARARGAKRKAKSKRKPKRCRCMSAADQIAWMRLIGLHNRVMAENAAIRRERGLGPL